MFIGDLVILAMSKEEQKELESHVTERLLETRGSLTGQDPFRIQERVSAAVVESLKSNLQPLVEDLVRGANNKDVPRSEVPGSSGGRCTFPHLG